MSNRPLYVTRPMLPDLQDLLPDLERIWDSGMVTNSGPFHNRLEAELRDYLDTETALLFSNGTIALMVALRLFDLPKGSEVITTPLTFAATAHAIEWNNLVPVFADIDPVTMTLDPASVEKAIRPNTSAILGVHVYGTMCDVDALEEIAKRHNVPLMFDAAHAFGATYKGRPVAQCGDASVFSFHATKLFTTLEGGLLATPRSEDQEPAYFLRNFGIKNEDEVVSVGLNGKINEVQAAIGLANLPKVAEEQAKRAKLRDAYDAMLAQFPGITRQVVQQGCFNSQQYYPIVVDPAVFGHSRDAVYDGLKEIGVFARKYFHPICTDFEPYKDFPIITAGNICHAQRLKTQVLCLPFFGGVTDEDVRDIEAVLARLQ